MPSKNLYSYISRNLNQKTTTINPLKINNELLTNNLEIANSFQNFFLNVYSSALPAPNLPIQTNDGLFDYSLTFINESHVYEELEKCNLKLNTSPDSIPYYFIRKCSLGLAKPFTYILRYSFIHCVLPSIWKTAIVCPIPKVPKASNIEDFRPISLTCSFSKIAEKFVYEEVLSFVEKCALLPNYQHGFRPNRSVYSQMAETLDDFTRALDNKLNVDCIYFDISKAFDTIEIDRIIAKLFNLGFTGNITSWIQNFLTNRKIQVKVNGTLSDHQHSPFSRGVPQGSLLGPIIFNLYMSDLTANFPHLSDIILKAYADDHKAYIIYKIIPKPNPLQLFCEHFSQWCNSNGLRISISKCFVMYIGNSNPHNPYTINHISIPTTQNIKDLGLHYNDKIELSIHIKQKAQQAFRKWFTFFKFFRSHNPNLYVKLYKLYVRPLVEFASFSFNSYSVSAEKNIESVQKRITRMIFRRCFPNIEIPAYQNRLNKLNLQTLKYRRDFNDLIFFHKIHQKIIPIHPHQFDTTNFKSDKRETIQIRFQTC